ncbi:hypothetical protein D3C78_890470 [compost metagenome]
MHRAHQWMTVDQGFKSLLEIAANDLCVLPELFFIHHIQHRHANAAADRTAPGRREEIAFSLQRFGNFPAGDHRTQWLAVAHALGHGDDVGHHALFFKAPEKLAHAAITHLHLIGDAHATLGADQGIDLLQVARWQ